ncbi:hypothetical protein GCM10010174_40820 [Kutzneria viridogrisea]|uniref:Uncharacterized protein n=2 Tax=Kutzneria TaxID=43356 RepID=W5W764_9PSEU|nr:hypothetical protein [Kutzneria albida]AHH96732.1 hypothetical protein KALB_3365 [Kutzneria albida DSM 43870]MBA8928049.1 hypothetical protein [Kutzneria viridogrisea]
MGAVFDGDRIRFTDYKIVCASVHPSGELSASRIRDADWSPGTMPEIRTHEGETLFLPVAQADRLRDFCQVNGIPQVRRPPVWQDLLEPYVDTDHNEEHRSRVAERLVRAGLDSAEVERIRARVGGMMVAFNAKVMDWAGLYHHDVLLAASGALVPAAHVTALGDPVEFYWWTMRIADRTP